MNFKNKISIGTAQFGLDYGIANKTGKISETEIIKILAYAAKNGITGIDTAQAYGDSEKVLGKAMSKSNKGVFSITTKISPDNLKRVEASFAESLRNLGAGKFDTVLFHDFESWNNNQESLIDLQKLKDRGLISKIGFSLYFPKDLEYLINSNIDFDAVQIPYNLFDRRFEKYFSALKEKDIIIQVRSVFLQGLFFIDPENLPDHFLQVRHKLQLLHNFSSNNNLPIKDLCLLFVLNNEFINTVIIGVDSLKNLEDNINIDWEKNKHHLPKITELNLQENNEDILIPSKWKI